MSAKTKKILLLFLCAAALAAFILFRVFSPGEQTYEGTGYAMGTFFQQTVAGANAGTAAEEAMKRISALEKKISWKISDSDIARVNQQAGKEPSGVSVSASTASLLREALTLAARSGGAYDPTVLPLTSLWNFDADQRLVPAADKLKTASALVDYRSAAVSDGTAALSREGAGIDLGGIGKGAACDEAVGAYRAAGVRSALISAGGSSIGMFGQKADGSPWRIAVRDPETPDSDADTLGSLSLSACFLSTSGIYEKCFRQNGVLYHHLLDPHTGYPVQNDLLSVTVVAEKGSLSDGLATACMVLGRAKGEALLRQYGAEAVFVARDKKVYVTAGLREKFRITGSKYWEASG